MGWQFLRGLLLVIVIPLCVLIGIFQGIVSRQYRDQACELNLQVLKQTQNSLESFAGDIEFVSKNILGDEQVQEYLKIYGKLDYQSTSLKRIGVSWSIQTIMQHRPIISAISIFDEEEIYCQFGSLVTQENRDHLEEVKALKGKGLWVAADQYDAPMSKNHADQYMVSFIRSINDLYSMNRLAIERISVKEESICQLYSGINTEGSTMFVMNSDGAIISSTDKSMLGTVVDQAVYTGGSTAEEGWHKKGTWIYTYYRLSHPDWMVVRVDPAKNFRSDSGQITLAFCLCLLLTGLFALLFYRIQDKTIIRPVKAIAKQTEHFRDAKAEIVMCTTGDNEIAVLNKAFVDMSVSIKQLIDQEYKSKLYQKEIELAYMQSQINPHFLYNTLESIRWMAVLHQQPEIADQVEALSMLFRRVLNEGKSTTTVREELEHVDVYMKLMQNRFGEKLQYEKHVDPELLDCEILHLVLQPLVENAIVHGIEKKRTAGYVRVTVCQADGSIFYLVHDNGVGANEEQVYKQMRNEDASKRAFALKNIDDRIKFRYGEEYGLTFKSAEGRGTTVTVHMPLKKKDSE